MKKYMFETENEDLLQKMRERFDRLAKMSREEQLADLVETGILMPDGELAPEYKPPEER